MSQFPRQCVMFPGAAARLAREHVPRGAGKVGHARDCARAIQLVDHLKWNDGAVYLARAFRFLVYP